MAHLIERNLFSCDFYFLELWRVSGPSVFFVLLVRNAKCKRG